MLTPAARAGGGADGRAGLSQRRFRQRRSVRRRRSWNWRTDEASAATAQARLRALRTRTPARRWAACCTATTSNQAPDGVLSFFLLTDYARLHPDDRLGPYLIGRQLLGRDPAHALPYLRTRLRGG